MTGSSTTAPLRAYHDAKAEYSAGLVEAETLAADWQRRNDPAWSVALHRVATGISRMAQQSPAHRPTHKAAP